MAKIEYIKDRLSPQLYRFEYMLKGSETTFTTNIVSYDMEIAKGHLINEVKKVYKQIPNIFYQSHVSRVDYVNEDAISFFEIDKKETTPVKSSPASVEVKTEDNKKYGWGKKE